MQYDNLKSLLRKSNTSRQYFLSLPVSVQMELHNHNNYIHSAQQLHLLADSIKQQNDKLKNISLFKK